MPPACSLNSAFMSLRCPLLCSLLIPHQPLPIFSHCVLIIRLLAFIKQTLTTLLGLTSFSHPFSFRFAVPLVPTNNWVLLNGTGEKKLYLFTHFPLSLNFGVIQRTLKPFHQNQGFYRAKMENKLGKHMQSSGKGLT